MDWTMSGCNWPQNTQSFLRHWGFKKYLRIIQVDLEGGNVGRTKDTWHTEHYTNKVSSKSLQLSLYSCELSCQSTPAVF